MSRQEKATLTKRVEFCASHRYHNPAWDAETNRRVFGRCNNEPSHGHNYLLEVTLSGDIDPVTGMIINIYDLKQYLWEILEEFDHKHLNLDTPYFQRTIPTTENLVHVLWRLFSHHPRIPTLEHIRLYEDEDLFADLSRAWVEESRATGVPRARVTRMYRFSAGHTEDEHLWGHDYSVSVAVDGPIHPETGQVVDLSDLDALVTRNVLDRFHGKDLRWDPAFQGQSVSEVALAGVIYRSLANRLRMGQVAGISVRASHRSEACYMAAEHDAVFSAFPPS